MDDSPWGLAPGALCRGSAMSQVTTACGLLCLLSLLGFGGTALATGASHPSWKARSTRSRGGVNYTQNPRKAVKTRPSRRALPSAGSLLCSGPGGCPRKWALVAMRGARPAAMEPAAPDLPVCGSHTASPLPRRSASLYSSRQHSLSLGRDLPPRLCVLWHAAGRGGPVWGSRTAGVSGQ